MGKRRNKRAATNQSGYRQRVQALYDTERTAYYRYIALSSGDSLVKGQRIRPLAVIVARQAWYTAYDNLRAVVSSEELREFLVEGLEQRDAT